MTGNPVDDFFHLLSFISLLCPGRVRIPDNALLDQLAN
jgi:hypothetical protein